MIQEVIVVEGKQDIAAVSRAVDADIIATNGFNLKPYTIQQIEKAYRTRGIIIMTDPDSAGERIRKILAEKFPQAKHAFMPREWAKHNDDIGIENASIQAIRTALNKVHYREWNVPQEFTLKDIIENGLTGTQYAADKREQLGQILGIGYTNAKQFLLRLNHYGIARPDFEQALDEVKKNNDAAGDCQ